jgi:hypothetical protein
MSDCRAGIGRAAGRGPDFAAILVHDAQLIDIFSIGR